MWRLFFILSALFMVVGGPRHPGGTMAEMLAHPDWVPSHALMLAGFVSLLVGLIVYQRSVSLPDRTRTWVGPSGTRSAGAEVQQICYAKGAAKEGSVLFAILYDAAWRATGIDLYFF